MTEGERINLMLGDPEKRTMTLAEIIAAEIAEFVGSEAYRSMTMAERYYRNRSDVQNKKNDVAQRSNTRIEHALLKKLVDQKADYLLARPFTVKAENGAYAGALEQVFDKGFRKRLKSHGRDAVKLGIAWLQPWFDETGLHFARLPSREVVPLWEDAEREKLGGYIRFYEQVVYVGNRKGRQGMAELWSRNGVQRFCGAVCFGAGAVSYRELEPDTRYGDAENGYAEAHFTLGGQGYSFDEVPIAWTRYNEEELPLWYFIRELIDDINWQTSVTADVLRDIAKFVYVLKNYGGQDLAEFVRDLQMNLAIKVDADGGVDKLAAELNIEAVMRFLEKNHQDAVYYASGVDTKDPALGNASGSAIQFRYMDLDNDCQALAAELQGMLERLKPFIDVWLQVSGAGDFSGESFEVVFNMDMPVNEGDVISNVRASEGVLSERTLLENHPWVVDAGAELAALAKEREEGLR